MTPRFALPTWSTLVLLSALWGVASSQDQRTLGMVIKLESEMNSRVDSSAQAIKGSPSVIKAGTSTGSGLVQVLNEAEEQYQLNMKARAPWYVAPLIQYVKDIVPELDAKPTYPCTLEARLGDWRDGAKWVCLKHLKMTPPKVLSIGCNGEKSFEEEVSKRMGGFSYVFDPSLNQDTQARMNSFPYLKFFNVGLAGTADLESMRTRFPNWEIVDVAKVLQMTGENFIDIFKIDCEGCELGVVDQMVELWTRDTVPIGQIQMELHNTHGRPRAHKVLTDLESLGFRLFHSEVNPFYPQHYEVAFVHERLVKPPTL